MHFSSAYIIKTSELILNMSLVVRKTYMDTYILRHANLFYSAWLWLKIYLKAFFIDSQSSATRTECLCTYIRASTLFRLVVRPTGLLNTLRQHASISSKCYTISNKNGQIIRSEFLKLQEAHCVKKSKEKSLNIVTRKTLFTILLGGQH